jgi:DNA adenine methylase
MKYLGSKNRISKYILPIILEGRTNGQYYVEPFVGGGNTIDKVGGNRIGSDSNKYMIALHKALQNGWIPPKNVSKEEYLHLKDNRDDYPLEMVGYFATQLVFGSVWFGSYRRDNKGNRDYDIEAYNNVMKQQPNLTDVEFVCCSYECLDIPPNSLIYCDPPYRGARPYIGDNKINHNMFWDWCRKASNEGHQVFISEYNAPDDFECVWEKEISSSGNGITDKKLRATEKLFIIK